MHKALTKRSNQIDDKVLKMKKRIKESQDREQAAHEANIAAEKSLNKMHEKLIAEEFSK